MPFNFHFGKLISLMICAAGNSAIDVPAENCAAGVDRQWMAIGMHTKVTTEPTVRTVRSCSITNFPLYVPGFDLR